MRLQLSYGELQTYLQTHHQQPMTFSFVDEKTVTIGKELDMRLFKKKVSVRVRVDQLVGTDLYLTYSAGLGLELMVKGAVKFFHEQIEGLVEESDGNTLIVHLAHIEQAKELFKKVKLQAVSFNPEGPHIQFTLL